MAKRIPKRSKKKTVRPIATLTIRGAAEHNDETAADVHAWVLLQMLDYFRSRKTFSKIETFQFNRRPK